MEPKVGFEPTTDGLRNLLDAVYPVLPGLMVRRPHWRDVHRVAPDASVAYPSGCHLGCHSGSASV
jgi:hypothetical protein